MPDDIKPGGPETGTPPETDPQPDAAGETPEAEAKPDADTPPWGDDFDAERAWNTITKLRQFEDKATTLEKRLAEIESEKAEQDRKAQTAEDEQLKEQQKWEELAEKRAARLLELEPLEPQVQTLEQERDSYKQALQEHVNAQLEGLPESVTELLSGMTPIKQLEWLGKHRDSYVKGKVQGVPDTPAANGTAKLTPEEKRRKAAIPGRDY